MARRRRLGGAYLLGSLLLLAASLHVPTAYSAPGDPPSGSPAGAVYELPLEQGRADGAPKGSGGTGAAAGGGSSGASAGGASRADESGSLYRTENNFGSSSRVPGLARTGAGGSAGAANGTGAPGGGGAGAGSGSGAGSAAVAGGAVAAEAADTGNTSVAAGIVLLGGIALLGAAVGILSRRFGGRAAG